MNRRDTDLNLDLYRYHTYKLENGIDGFWDYCITRLRNINNSRVYISTMSKCLEKDKKCIYSIQDVSELSPISKVKSCRSI